MTKKSLHFFLSRRKEEFLNGIRQYSFSLCKYRKTAVAVCDGLYYSGGMTDRFKSIISLYTYAKRFNVPFRIKYSYPFELTDYLVPNTYSWIPERKDYVKSNFTSRLFYVVGEPNHVFRLKVALLFGIRQIHYYGNRDVTHFKDNASWGICFNELFKPAPKLEIHMSNVKNAIGKSYYSVVFRFQNLLDDFHEYELEPLKKDEQLKLIDDCLYQLSLIQNKHADEACLVTSDSISFLEKVKVLENVHIIPGNLIHMGSNTTGNYEDYEKSFLDFFMLADSTKIYNIKIREMYPSGFPEYAAKLHDIPFERISID